MKTITIEDDVYRKLADAKAGLGTRSFSETLRRILSEDRVRWVSRLAGKIDLDEDKMKKLDGGWRAWHIK